MTSFLLAFHRKVKYWLEISLIFLKHIQMYGPNKDIILVNVLSFLKLSCLNLFVLQNNHHAHTRIHTPTHRALKITLSPQNICALMPALYSLAINKTDPCAILSPVGNKKTVSNSQENLVQTVRMFTLHWRHQAQLKNRLVQQWKINEVA